MMTVCAYQKSKKDRKGGKKSKIIAVEQIAETPAKPETGAELMDLDMGNQKPSQVCLRW